MKTLRYYQETIFFFILVLLFAATLVTWIPFREHLSYPLPGIHSETQKMEVD